MVLIMIMMLMMMMMMGSIWEASHSWLLSSPQGLTHSIISSTALFAKKPMNSAIIVMIMVNTTGHVVLYTNQYLPSHFLFRKVIGILWKVKHYGWMTVFSIQYASIHCPCCLFFSLLLVSMLFELYHKNPNHCICLHMVNLSNLWYRK